MSLSLSEPFPRAFLKSAGDFALSHCKEPNSKDIDNLGEIKAKTNA
jgi:hypothetical protein